MPPTTSTSSFPSQNSSSTSQSSSATGTTETVQNNSSKQPLLPAVSIVIPCYNETENVRPLCERLFKAMSKDLPHIQCELLLVDDESQGSEATQKLVDLLAKEENPNVPKKSLASKLMGSVSKNNPSNSCYPIRIHRRYKKDGRGLSSAVMLGFEQAKYEVVLSMDADLQHEPESVPAVLLPVLEQEAEFTVGCRYMKHGGIGFHWSLIRQILSRGATLLALGLTSSKDPMSGFFCTTKSVIKKDIGRGPISPIGFKIGLEIMARTGCKVQDVPITFRERLHGESKLSGKQQVEYVMQLMGLYWAAHRVKVVVFIIFIIGVLMGIYKAVIGGN